MSVDTEMRTIDLRPNVSLSEVMRRVHRSAGTIIIKFSSRRWNEGGGAAHWRLHIIGPTPDLSGLVP